MTHAIKSKKIGLRSPYAEYFRFGAAGVLNTITDFLVLNGLLSALGEAQGTLYIIAKTISFAVAVIQSYFLNKYWVFEARGTTDSKTQEKLREGGKFAAVSATGLVFNIAASAFVFWMLGALGMADYRLKANIGAVAGTLLVLAWNYTGYKFFVFKPQSVAASNK